MKKEILSVMAAILLLAGMAGVSEAALITIGTATYGGSDYNLIYDADSPGGPITWLDYSNSPLKWESQVDWADGLGAELTVTLNPGYTTDNDWATGWRLPSAGANPQCGHDQTTSEMGHLFYDELGLNADYLPTTAELNAGKFDNLIASWYWSGTEHAGYPYDAWSFGMGCGYQQGFSCKYNGAYGLAVRSGQVSAVPIPGAIWLLGSGLASMVALGRRRKGNRV